MRRGNCRYPCPGRQLPRMRETSRQSTENTRRLDVVRKRTSRRCRPEEKNPTPQPIPPKADRSAKWTDKPWPIAAGLRERSPEWAAKPLRPSRFRRPREAGRSAPARPGSESSCSRPEKNRWAPGRRSKKGRAASEPEGSRSRRAG